MSHTIELGVQRGEQADDLNAWLLLQQVEFPCAVLAATP
jgi:hypothetical protein